MSHLPDSSADRKDVPVTTGVFDYFPNAIAAVAVVSKRGNDKHNPGEPLHWSRDKSNDHADCIGRHLIERGGFDAEGVRHSAQLAWRALANLEEELIAEGATPGQGTSNEEPVTYDLPIHPKWNPPVAAIDDLTGKTNEVIEDYVGKRWRVIAQRAPFPGENYVHQSPSGLYDKNPYVGERGEGPWDVERSRAVETPYRKIVEEVS